MARIPILSDVMDAMFGKVDYEDDSYERAKADEAERQAKEAGYCIHCGSDIDDCTGYKCWIR